MHMLFTITIPFHTRDLNFIKPDSWQILRDDKKFMRLLLKGIVLNIIRIFKGVVLVLKKFIVQLKKPFI